MYQLCSSSEREEQLRGIIKEIAQLLQIGVKTGETNRAQTMERLGLHDDACLVHNQATFSGMVK